MNALQSAHTHWTGITDRAKEFSMEKAHHPSEGLLRMIEKGKASFHISENIDYYSEKDYRQAEKIFIKRCVLGREC